MLGSLSIGIFNGLHFPVCRPAVVDVAPKRGIDNDQPNHLTFGPSTVERIGSNKISQSEVDWVISSAG